MLSRPLLATSIALLAIATAVTPARAQDAQTQAMGRALFNEGVALFNQGDFEAACPKLEASLKHYPGLGTRGKLAECYEKLGRFASAWQAYREVAQIAKKSGDPTREQIASERAKSLEPKLSYVTVIVPPASEAPGMVVKRNGREVDRAKLGSAEPVDSGTITIDVTAPGRKPFAGKLSVAQGVSTKFEVPALALDAPRPLPSSVPAPVAPPPATFEEPLPVQHDPPSWQKPLGIALVVGGVVGLGAGGVFGLAARSKYEGAFDGGGCDRPSKTCDAAGQSAIDDARSRATVSTILFAAGGGLVLAGAIVIVTAPSSKPRALRIAPTPYAGGAGLTFGGTL